MKFRDIFFTLTVFLFLQGCPLTDATGTDDGENQDPGSTTQTTDLTAEEIAAKSKTELKDNMLQMVGAIKQVGVHALDFFTLLGEDMSGQISSELQKARNTDSTETEVKQFIEYFSPSVADDNSIVYSIGDKGQQDFCGELMETVTEQCKNAVANIKLVQKAVSVTAGELALHYAAEDATYVPYQLSYSDNEWVLTSDFPDGIKALTDLNNAIGSGVLGVAFTQVPEVLSGVAKLSLKKVDADTINVTSEIVEDIEIKGKIGSADTDVIDINIGSAKAFQLVSDKSTNKIQVTLDTSSMFAMFYDDVYVGYDENTFEDIFQLKKLEFSFSGIIGVFELDIANKKATATGAGLREGGLAVKEDDVTILSVTSSISGYTLSVPGEEDEFVIRAMADSAAELVINAKFFGPEYDELGAISVSAAEGTTLDFYNTQYLPPYYDVQVTPSYVQVVAGEFSIEASGAAGNEDGSARTVAFSTGQCFTESVNEDMPMAYLCPGDVSGLPVFTIETVGNALSTFSTDTYLTLYNANLDLINYNDDYNDVYSKVDAALIPGETYFVKVSGYDEFSTGAYSLRVSDTGPGVSSAGTPIDEADPENDISTGAEVIQVNSVKDNTLTMGDVDWYKFTVPMTVQ